MPRRVKEDEKVEMIIRGLLKQLDNRRCINCNTLGPQYVCTTFWTFVCTNCSGVHREFTHRVKSVSMAKFSDEEIISLQAGGNERAKQIYFKSWDPHHNSYPNSSNLQRLREFVSSVYIERRYAGENNSNKLSSPQSESRNSFCEWPSERSRWGRSPDYMARSPGSSSGRDEPYDHGLFERSSSGKGLNLKDFLEERSPRSNHVAMPRSSSHRSRPTRFEIVDDRFREDGSVRRYERGTGSGGRSPCSLRSPASLPTITPISAFLGDKAPELRVAEPPAVDDHKASVGGQKAAAADADVDANKKGNEATNAANLIDFLDAEPEANEKMASNTTPSTTAEATAIVPINSVEALLFELSAPTPSSSSVAMQPNTTDAAEIETTEAHQVSNSSEALAITVVAGDQQLHIDDSNHMMQDVQTHHLPLTTLQTASSLESSLNEQGSCRSPASDDLRRTRSVPIVQALEAANPSPSARKEIPEDLFSSGFPLFAPAGWPHGAGYGVQFHHPAMHVATYQNPPRPKNPFEIDDDRFQVQAPTFPSMSPLHGAHPNIPISAASQPQPPPYPPPPYMTSFGMNMPLVPGAYMVQLSNNMMLVRPESRNEDAFASLNPITRGSGSAAPTSALPRAGNPFG